MKWTRSAKKNPKVGDKRTIKRFLFFPVTIGDETRWLETALIAQSRVNMCTIEGGRIIDHGGRWINENWIGI